MDLSEHELPQEDLREAEQALRASEERFRALVQFSFDVYWETDAQHRFTRDGRGHTAARNLAKILLGSRCTVHGRAAGEP